MRPRHPRWGRRAGGALTAALLALQTATAPAASPAPATAAAAHAAPRLYPDYADIVLPPNIAPLNFRIEEPGSRYRVRFQSSQGEPILLTSGSPAIRIPLKPWRQLLGSNPGQALRCEVAVQDAQGRWRAFAPITNRIALEPVDAFLTYRLLKPLYNAYVNLGIYQRNLESFEERPVLQNQRFGGDCLNCHTFLNRRGDFFAFNTRSATYGTPMILVQSNQATRVDRTMGYLAWHPSGRLLAFSANKLSMIFHAVGETRDVYDAASNLGLYHLDSNRVEFPSAIAQTNHNETWPAWSPDGQYLYYASAPPTPVKQFRQVRYDLVRARYDLERDQWGEPEVLVSAAETGRSATQPKVSPDGRFVLFCLSQYGNFPVYQPSSDLHLLDLQTRRHRRLEINSAQADSWHCWSGNSRWVVFSSKRLDGLFARPYFTYVDKEGRFHKPFVLPQKDPGFYETCLNTFNVPELSATPVLARQEELARAITRPVRRIKPVESTPAAAAEAPRAPARE